MTPPGTRDGFRLLIFDWDGTLLDSIATIVACTQQTLAELGMPAADEEGLRAAIGLGIRETVDRFVPGCTDDTFGRIVAVYRRLWFDDFCHRPRLIHGARQALEVLERRGYWLALATAKGRRGLDLDLARTGLAGHFLATRTVDEAPSKPHPEMVLGILDELGSVADETLVIGDTVHDLEMARLAGARAVGVCSGTHDRRALLVSRPLACLASVAELPAWLAR